LHRAMIYHRPRPIPTLTADPRAACDDLPPMTVDPRAATGFGAGVDAYERGRPSYPQAAIERLAREFELSSDSSVVDLAAGTGKLGRSLAPLVGSLIAVEPSPAMLAELGRRAPMLDAREGTAEAIPLPDGSVQAVFVGQAFHWFRTAEALDEIARVLAPGGGLALLWNHARWSEAELPWLTHFRKLVEPRREAAGSFPAGDDRWKDVLAGNDLFTPLRSVEFPHVHRTGTEDFLDLVVSWSWIANLRDEERSGLLDQVRAMIGGGGELELPYRTQVYWTRRVG
jgi:SAM-dependent methyltransferase